MLRMWIEHVDEMAQLASAAEALTRRAHAATDRTARNRLLSLAMAHREMLSLSVASAADEPPADPPLVEDLLHDLKSAA